MYFFWCWVAVLGKDGPTSPVESLWCKDKNGLQAFLRGRKELVWPGSGHVVGCQAEWTSGRHSSELFDGFQKQCFLHWALLWGEERSVLAGTLEVLEFVRLCTVASFWFSAIRQADAQSFRTTRQMGWSVHMAASSLLLLSHRNTMLWRRKPIRESAIQKLGDLVWTPLINLLLT